MSAPTEGATSGAEVQQQRGRSRGRPRGSGRGKYMPTGRPRGRPRGSGRGTTRALMVMVAEQNSPGGVDGSDSSDSESSGSSTITATTAISASPPKPSTVQVIEEPAEQGERDEQAVPERQPEFVQVPATSPKSGVTTPRKQPRSPVIEIAPRPFKRLRRLSSLVDAWGKLAGVAAEPVADVVVATPVRVYTSRRSQSAPIEPAASSVVPSPDLLVSFELGVQLRRDFVDKYELDVDDIVFCECTLKPGTAHPAMCRLVCGHTFDVFHLCAVDFTDPICPKCGIASPVVPIAVAAADDHQ